MGQPPPGSTSVTTKSEGTEAEEIKSDEDMKNTLVDFKVSATEPAGTDSLEACLDLNPEPEKKRWKGTSAGARYEARWSREACGDQAEEGEDR